MGRGLMPSRPQLLGPALRPAALLPLILPLLALLAFAATLTGVAAAPQQASPPPAAAAAVAVAALPPPATCPGIDAAGTCTTPCQLATCRGLAGFYKGTFNASMPWDHPETWLVRSTPCEEIIGAGAPAGSRPPYCSWYGIACCLPAAAAAGRCWPVNGVANITLRADNINGSISNPELMDAFDLLHACGLTALNLESNDMSGYLTPRWARFTNLTVLNLANSWLSGTLPPELGNLTRLRRLELGTNFFAGTVGDWIGRLKDLEVLTLGANAGVNEAPAGSTEEELAGLIGQLPASFEGLTKLVELDLQLNSFTGTMPPTLCSPASQLRVINLRGNRFEGPAAPLTQCTQLESLDVSGNQLTGSLPSTPDWQRMVSLMLSGNQFVGTLPESLYDMPMVTYLDISHNNLSGRITEAISLLVYITDLDVSNTGLEGELVSGIFFLPQLARLNLAGNKFKGTLTSDLGLAFNLKELSLVNNTGLVGRLPDEAAGLSQLRRLSLTGTSLSCVPDEVALAAAAAVASGAPLPPPYRCPKDQLLPCFLEFDMSYEVPRGDATHMSCRPIRYKSAAGVERSCPPKALVDAKLPYGAPLDVGWELSPSYYQYQGCRCLSGYRPVWSAGGTLLTCVVRTDGGLPPWTWVLVGVGAALLLLAASLLVLGNRWALVRSRLAREAELGAKRKRGMPRAPGAVTVVVTDIEGYSSLMKANPSMMARALAMHNAVLRKGAHDHAGHVIEQEGDSWAVAFYDAQDAAGFCLQAQQALRRVDWPFGLTGVPTGHGGNAAGAGRASTGGGSTRPPPSRSSGSMAFMHNGYRGLRGLLGVGSLGMAPRPSFSSGLARTATQESLDHFATAQTAGGVGGSNRGFPPGSPDALILRGVNGDGMGPFGSPTLELIDSSNHRSATEPGAGDSESIDGASSRQSLSGQLPQLRSASSEYDRAGTGLFASTISGTLMTQSRHGGDEGMTEIGSRARSGSRRKFSLTRSRRSARERLLEGLHVRMGVASGMLGEGTEVGSSWVFELAKTISDMANGGQTLMDWSTFDQIKDARELGAVDHHGYNEQLLLAQSGALRLVNCNGCRGGPCDKEGLAAAEGSSNLVILDMGEFEPPAGESTAAVAAAAALAGARSAGAPSAGAPRAPPPVLQTTPSLRRRSGNATDPAAGPATAPASGKAAAPADGKGTTSGVPGPAAAAGNATAGPQPARLRLYSLLPTCLAERAKDWGNCLSLRDGWRQTDPGFFDAPGARVAASLAPQTAVLAGAAMPAVTSVFAAVEGARALTRLRGPRAADASEALSLLRLVIRASLAAVPGGYLCREQEGELRYMLAFPDAQGALQWCLLVQEALMYAPWPAAVLELPECAEKRAADDGRLLFRGPRLKMGLCEGVPRSLCADHLGRADYFGSSVNSAARFMDAAAHGGQVACDVVLATEVFSTWRGEGGACDDAGLLSLPPPTFPASGSEGDPTGSFGDRSSLGSIPGYDAPSPPAAVAASGSVTAAAMAAWRAGAGASTATNGAATPPARAGPLPWPVAQRRASVSDLQGSGPAQGAAAPPATPPQQAFQQQPPPGPPVIKRQSGDSVGPLPGELELARRSQSDTQLLGRRGAHPGALGLLGPMAAMRQRLVSAGAAAPVADDAATAPARRNVAVRALHLGTFVFKGCDPVDMVSVTAAALEGRAALLPREEPRGKGRKVVERTGPANAAVAPLPDVLEGLRGAFESSAAATAAAAANSGAEKVVGGDIEAPPPVVAGCGGAGYVRWLSQELARRRLFVGDGTAPMMGQMRLRSFSVQRPSGGTGGLGGYGSGLR